MEIVIPLSAETWLNIGCELPIGAGYPTARLQKGLLLFHKGQSLAEEGVGFGMPVVKRGTWTIFPGHVELTSQVRNRAWIVTAQFRMNLEERITMPRMGSIESTLVYRIKNSLADLHRRLPLLRKLLTTVSNGLRHSMRMETTYQEIDSYGFVGVTFTVFTDLWRVMIAVDSTGLHKECLTDIVMMNEQGAHTFDLYRDSMGTDLRGEKIGTWDEVFAKEASFISATHHLAFTFRQVEGARLFRGRESIGSRLAWSGFGYSFDIKDPTYRYDLKLENHL